MSDQDQERSEPSAEKRPRSPLSDTHPEAERVMIEIYRRMPGWRKLQQVSQLTRIVIDLALADTRQRHPNASERELRLRVASRWLPPETMRLVFDWDPDKEGY